MRYFFVCCSCYNVVELHFTEVRVSVTLLGILLSFPRTPGTWKSAMPIRSEYGASCIVHLCQLVSLCFLNPYPKLGEFASWGLSGVAARAWAWGLSLAGQVPLLGNLKAEQTPRRSQNSSSHAGDCTVIPLPTQLSLYSTCNKSVFVFVLLTPTPP